MVLLDLGLRPRQRRRAVERGRIAILLGEVEGRRARRRDERREGHAHRLAGRDQHAPPQAHDRIEHRAGRVGQRPAVDHRRRCPDPAPAAEEAARDRSPTAGRRPSRPRPSTTWASQTGASPLDRGRRVASSVSSSGTHSVCTLRLENAGWASVRRRRRQHDLGVRRQLDLPRPRPEIRERDAPHLGIVLRRHDHLERGAHGPVAPNDLRAVLGERDRVAVRLAAPRLVAGRPGLAAVDVAKEHVRPPPVARDVLPPARDGEVAPAAVSRARRRQHHRVASVREQLRPRHRAVRRAEAPLDGRHELAHVADGLDLVRARPRDRHVPRRPLLQEQLGGLDHRLGVKARAHRRRRAGRSRSPRSACPGGAPCRRAPRASSAPSGSRGAV